MTKEAVLSKVQGLLALADKARNNSEQEAMAAMLKAQELMAKYHIAMEQLQEKEEEAGVIRVACTSKWNYSFRYPLAVTLANNFRCEAFVHGNTITGIGHPTDVALFKQVFEFAYTIITRGANRQYNIAYNTGRQTQGVFNSYARGFISGLREQLDRQCEALAIVVPQTVKDELARVTQSSTKTRAMTAGNSTLVDFEQGRKDGQSFATSHVRK